jgi:hypothetical protein
VTFQQSPVGNKTKFSDMEVTIREIMHNFLESQASVPKADAENDEDFEDIDDIDESKLSSKNSNKLILWLDGCFATSHRVCHILLDKMDNKLEATWGPMSQSYVYNNTIEVVWSIDQQARRFFPFLFLILQLIYWTSYLYVL